MATPDLLAQITAFMALPLVKGDHSELAVLTFPDNELDVKVGYSIDRCDGSVLVESVHTWHSAKEWGPDFMDSLTREQVEDLADQILPCHRASQADYAEYARSER